MVYYFLNIHHQHILIRHPLPVSTRASGKATNTDIQSRPPLSAKGWRKLHTKKPLIYQKPLSSLHRFLSYFFYSFAFLLLGGILAFSTFKPSNPIPPFAKFWLDFSPSHEVAFVRERWRWCLTGFPACLTRIPSKRSRLISSTPMLCEFNSLRSSYWWRVSFGVLVLCSSVFYKRWNWSSWSVS